MNEAGTVAIVYESMFGSTRRIAEAIAEQLRSAHTVHVTPVNEAHSLPDDLVALIVGAPTHAHGLSRPGTRLDAMKWAADDHRDLQLEAGFDGLGVREWMERLEPQVSHHVAFDTRIDMPRIFTGSAAAAIDRELTELGSRRIVEPMSFFVDRNSHLEPGQIERAREWGAVLAESLTATAMR